MEYNENTSELAMEMWNSQFREVDNYSEFGALIWHGILSTLFKHPMRCDHRHFTDKDAEAGPNNLSKKADKGNAPLTYFLLPGLASLNEVFTIVSKNEVKVCFSFFLSWLGRSSHHLRYRNPVKWGFTWIGVVDAPTCPNRLCFHHLFPWYNQAQFSAQKWLMALLIYS